MDPKNEKKINTQELYQDLSQVLSLEGLPEAEREEAISSVLEYVVDETMQQVLRDMSEAESVAFLSFLETDPNEDQIFSYVEVHVPQFQIVMKQVTDSFLRSRGITQ